jgi:hypothetical protein
MEKIEITNRAFPARLTAEQTATLLGFQIHDIPVLVALGKLKPLGNPTPNAKKYFATVHVHELAEDQTWLSKATQAVYEHWQEKNAARTKMEPDTASG